MRLSGHKSVEGKPPSLLRVGILAGRVASLSFISECAYLERVLEVAGSGHFLLPATWREGSGAQSFPNLTIKHHLTKDIFIKNIYWNNRLLTELSDVKTNPFTKNIVYTGEK